MRIDFKFDPMRKASYCIYCNRELSLEESKNVDGSFTCPYCKHASPRAIIIDPAIKWWLSADNVYHHASAGIIFVDTAKNILFFELTKFPYGLTVPAGHVDADESPLQAAVREAEEETGLNGTHPRLIVETHINGDECRRGCDDHEWSLFYYQVSDDEKASLKIDASEGKEPVWLTLDELPSRIKKMPAAMQYLFTNHSDEIEAVILKH